LGTLPEPLHPKASLRHKVRQALERLEEQERRYCHPQEPEAVRLNMPEGSNRFGYNAQLVVDDKAQIITAAEVVAQSNDLSLAMPMEQQSRDNTGASSRQLAIDSGYCTKATVSQAQARGLDLLMPLPKPMQGPASEPYHSSHFAYDEKRDVVICPQAQELSFKKERWRHGQRVRQYRNGKACGACALRAQCTRARAGRSIDITGHEAALARHRERMKRPDAQGHYRRRAGVVEPVFARIKEHGEFRRFTLRGLQKVRVQWSMICSAANLKRLFSFWKQGLRAHTA
jgi:transposase